MNYLTTRSTLNYDEQECDPCKLLYHEWANSIRRGNSCFNVYILIVQTSVEQTTNSYVAIVGKDVDFACLFIASTPPAQDILRWFHKILLEDRSHKASGLGILQLYLH